jgi:hypothetical protein
MYRLMKSKKVTLDHPISGLMSSYRQIQVDHFQNFRLAVGACEAANNKSIMTVLGSIDHDPGMIAAAKRTAPHLRLSSRSFERNQTNETK